VRPFGQGVSRPTDGTGTGAGTDPDPSSLGKYVRSIIIVESEIEEDDFKNA
jgi:hypothetical protein